MTHVAINPKLCSVVGSSMHPCHGNGVAIGQANQMSFGWSKLI